MKLKVWATALALCVAFAAGYRYSAALYDADIAALREDYATRAQALEAKYREKERVQYQSLVEAWQARDEALSLVDALNGDLTGCAVKPQPRKRRLSANSAVACKSEREQLARCADLLERGTELVRRGVELSERTAIDKDAMAMIVSQ